MMNTICHVKIVMVNEGNAFERQREKYRWTNLMQVFENL